MHKNNCIFCNITLGLAPSTTLFQYFCSMFEHQEIIIKIIKPLNPVTNGHLLVICNYHTENASEIPDITGMLFKYASFYCKENNIENYNLITSNGEIATQTVFHTHIHIVPRSIKDELHLPWTDQIIN